ncbi:putative sterol 24-c-methyltransferase protein [Eutypa lata UCREL1]|uniref:Sterol 24-C-methyltransferase n=1 Tax=Eutypa lata (strain UCR-EL1) TaxID=1287681 RepID=M7TZ29_EUTLA|nr:putative sterol 24-c-methyltransferase protein [Eutypa lata UCREL1]
MGTSRELITAENAKNSAFDHALHRTSTKAQGGLRAMMNKDSAGRNVAMGEYFQHWDNKKAEDETEAIREARTADYANLTRQYYNLATDLYEYAWGECFHFCRFAYGEPFAQAIARHEHYLAHSIDIKPGMRVLDVGCGVGGPAREIVKFAGCHVTGLNINGYQVQRATSYAAKEGLSHKLDFKQGDFMNLPFPDKSFDAAYAIEATVHAPSLQGVYSEIFRVLKPGGTFGVYEWLMTDAYDNDDLEHRRIRLDIEQGNGIAQMVKIAEGLEAIRAAGFELELHHDLAAEDDGPAPWYWPLGSDVKYAQNLWDLFTVLRMNKWGRNVSHSFMSLLETIRVLPAGTRETAESLGRGADALVDGGNKKLFTPMYLMVARKPII